jgi:hypothetical protein
MVAAVLTVAAVVVAINSAKGPQGAARIEAAIRWPTNCGAITISRPSRAPIMSRWSSATVRTADIVCSSTGSRVTYARFRDAGSMNLALAAHEPTARYCLVGASIVIDQLAALDQTVFTDMCRSLSGTFVNAGP